MNRLFGTEQMRACYVAVLLAVAAPVAWADPPKLEIPQEVRPAGEWVRMTPKGDAVSVVYVGLSGLDPFPAEELKDAKRFLLHTRGIPAGRYTFAAVGSGKSGEQTRTDFVVVIGDAPAPPVPVPPGPTPPAPADPLVKALAAAFAKETAADKSERLRVLVAVMRKGATFARAADITTNQQLTAAVSKERAAQVGDSLHEVRAEIGRYLAGQFDTTVFTLADADRAKFAAAYTKLADALAEVVN